MAAISGASAVPASLGVSSMSIMVWSSAQRLRDEQRQLCGMPVLKCVLIETAVGYWTILPSTEQAQVTLSLSKGTWLPLSGICREKTSFD
jgi:hypothetical protein